MDRNTTITTIRKALKRRSGKPWSVTGGRGTAWGWITIDALPAQCTWRFYLPNGLADLPANYKEHDTGKPGGHMSHAESCELDQLLGLPARRYPDSILIPAAHDYWREYIDRAEGRKPTVEGKPYWD